ncbi:MAG: PIG-L deacetylase family protein [Deltaproteobacteria bacterium]|nr:PIG-L deacetylase family protein [Deltaproteobacteria bacterium]
MALRRRLCDALIRLCLARGRALSEAELRRPALVIAPHPDDEVLGCGGTIRRMRQLGVPVDLLFLTDGRHSHRGAVDRATLARQREAEARGAAAALLVEPARVHFLAHEDLHLADAAAPARQQVAAWLRAHRPLQVLIPSRHDGHPDHRAANHIARAALRDAGLSAAILEYVVHLWWRWPWCARSPEGAAYPPGERLRGLLAALRTLLLASRFARIEADHKRQALAAHASQVGDLLPGGPNLQRWSDGEYLAWACAEHELFRPAS